MKRILRGIYISLQSLLFATLFTGGCMVTSNLVISIFKIKDHAAWLAITVIVTILLVGSLLLINSKEIKENIKKLK